MKCVGYFLHSSCSQSILNNWPIVLLMVFGSFSFVPPPQYVMRPPFKEHVSLHAKSLCKNMACASGGGGVDTNGKDPDFHVQTIEKFC